MEVVVSRINRIIIYSVLTLGACSMILPLLWMISTALKSPGDVFAYPPKCLPTPIHWDNFSQAWNSVPFARYYLNSIYVAFCVTIGQVVTSAMAGYAFARLNFPFRDKIFFGYLATLMIPGSVTMIPVFIIIRMLGWVDTYQALIIPGIFSAYGTFMLRQFFMSIPRSLEEAAMIDGASLPRIFLTIILPLSKPALATLSIFTFMGNWGSFMWPLVVTYSDNMRTLPVGLMNFQGAYNTEWNLLMAGALIVMIPVLLVFIINQRFFVDGIKLSGMGGM